MKICYAQIHETWQFQSFRKVVKVKYRGTKTLSKLKQRIHRDIAELYRHTKFFFRVELIKLTQQTRFVCLPKSISWRLKKAKIFRFKD